MEIFHSLQAAGIISYNDILGGGINGGGSGGTENRFLWLLSWSDFCDVMLYVCL